MTFSSSCGHHLEPTQSQCDAKIPYIFLSLLICYPLTANFVCYLWLFGAYLACEQLILDFLALNTWLETSRPSRPLGRPLEIIIRGKWLIRTLSSLLSWVYVIEFLISQHHLTTEISGNHTDFHFYILAVLSIHYTTSTSDLINHLSLDPSNSMEQCCFFYHLSI